MKNIFIINAHQPYPFSPGKLNQALVELAVSVLENKGYSIRSTDMTQDWQVADELEKHQWADVIILQTPVNWMGVPWIFKKYMDEIYSAGMDGTLCNGDGRSRQDPSRHYGSGGTLTQKQYMLSLTFNAPESSFDDSDQFLFGGRSVDDLFFPMHMNFRFFDMQPLPCFACYDVMKNPTIEQDFQDYEAHLNQYV